MSRSGPLRSAEFLPDVPAEHLRGKGKIATSTAVDSSSGGRGLDAVAIAKQQREALAREQYRHRARFVQSDYSTFDSHVSDRLLIRYYCTHCGNFCGVMESRLQSAAVRRLDCSRCIDISTQVIKLSGIEKSKKKDKSVIKLRSSDGYKLEIRYHLQCKKCHLPVAYVHNEPIESEESDSDELDSEESMSRMIDLSNCSRLFVLDDALSDDPTAFSSKIDQLSRVLSLTY